MPNGWRLGFAMVVALLAVALPIAVEHYVVRPDLAALEVTPRRWAGKLHGPAGRVTPAGTPAAAFWWSVESTDEEHHETYCRVRARDHLVLETATGNMAIRWSGIDPDLAGLVSEDGGAEYGFRFMFDLGGILGMKADTLPAGTCTGDDARYGELAIPDGQPVEVAGCLDDGVIIACDGAIGGILAVDGIDAHLDRARSHARRPRWFALGACAGVLIFVGFAVYAAKDSRNVRA